MKKIIYILMSVYLLAITVDNTYAQNWRGKHNGLPTGFSAKTVYGDGTNILVSNSTGFGGSQMYYTSDSTTPYNASPSSIGMFATPESHVVKCMNVLFIGSSGGLYKSHDNGQTWSVAGGVVSATYSVYAHNDTLYGGFGFEVKMSADTGNTWTSLGNPGSLAVALIKSGATLYVGGTSDLHYTNDNGTTWTNVTAPASIIGAAFADFAELGGSIYGATNNGVYKTSDNGHSWTRVIAKVMTSLISIDTSLLGGTSINGIYQSDVTGTTWSAINNGLPFTGVATYNSVNAIAYNDNYIMCSASGDSTIYVIGYAELGLNPALITTAINMPSNQEINVTLLPNPAHDQVVIDMGNGSKEKTITFYDVTGHNMKSINANAPNTTIDLKDIAAGLYFVHITQGNKQNIKKLVVIK